MNDGINGKAIVAVLALLGVGILLTVGLVKARSDNDEAVKPLEVSLIDADDRVELPEFSGTDVNGEKFSSADMELPATIHVFASWCTVCRGEAKEYGEFMADRPEMNYYFVAVQDKPKDATDFAESYDWLKADKDLVILDDPERTIEEESLRLPGGQPHTIMVNADGEVAWVRQGASSLPELLGAADAVTESA